MFTSTSCQSFYIGMQLSSTFSGSYDLLKYIINKYELYDGQITKLVYKYNFRITCCSEWKNNVGVPLRVWNMLYKDLTILSLSGLIEFDNLEQLRNEYESIS
jgi:hypothetical protein